MSNQRVAQKVKDKALLAAGFNHGQEPLDKTTDWVPWELRRQITG